LDFLLANKAFDAAEDQALSFEEERENPNFWQGNSCTDRPGK
jgi:hypothetical protein